MYTQEEMNRLVPQKLQEIEKEQDITILWACESGSRAWGFASRDSDFDVRFIYKHNWEAYLRLEDTRDVIEYPVDAVWDVNGWDLDKTLRLLMKSNPALYEWLNSPIVYCSSDFRADIEPLLQAYYSESKMLHHYLHTAAGMLAAVEKKERVRAKKYFYILRPLLACLWIRAYHEAPPVRFEKLLCMLDDSMRPSVERLLAIKMNTREADEIPHDDTLLEYMHRIYTDTEAYLLQLPKEDAKNWDLLNQFFRQEVCK